MNINNILKTMHSQKQATDKGAYGEEAAFKVCELVAQKMGGILIHSYTYKTEPGLAGNIKVEGGKLKVENLGGHTEIDILLVTPYRIYPIEVKAYKANTITLTNTGISGCSATSKSPVHQNEMHMRHLYPQIFKNIPDGSTKFVVPIVVFVDRCKVKDMRTKDNKDYISVCILSNLMEEILKHSKPINNTIINLKEIERTLRTGMISNEKFLVYGE